MSTVAGHRRNSLRAALGLHGGSREVEYGTARSASAGEVENKTAKAEEGMNNGIADEEASEIAIEKASEKDVERGIDRADSTTINRENWTQELYGLHYATFVHLLNAESWTNRVQEIVRRLQRKELANYSKNLEERLNSNFQVDIALGSLKGDLHEILTKLEMLKHASLPPIFYDILALSHGDPQELRRRKVVVQFKQRVFFLPPTVYQRLIEKAAELSTYFKTELSKSEKVHPEGAPQISLKTLQPFKSFFQNMAVMEVNKAFREARFRMNAEAAVGEHQGTVFQRTLQFPKRQRKYIKPGEKPNNCVCLPPVYNKRDLQDKRSVDAKLRGAVGAGESERDVGIEQKLLREAVASGDADVVEDNAIELSFNERRAEHAWRNAATSLRAAAQRRSRGDGELTAGGKAVREPTVMAKIFDRAAKPKRVASPVDIHHMGFSSFSVDLADKPWSMSSGELAELQANEGGVKKGNEEATMTQKLGHDVVLSAETVTGPQWKKVEPNAKPKPRESQPPEPPQAMSRPPGFSYEEKGRGEGRGESGGNGQTGRGEVKKEVEAPPIKQGNERSPRDPGALRQDSTGKHFLRDRAAKELPARSKAVSAVEASAKPIATPAREVPQRAPIPPVKSEESNRGEPPQPTQAAAPQDTGASSNSEPHAIRVPAKAAVAKPAVAKAPFESGRIVKSSEPRGGVDKNEGGRTIKNQSQPKRTISIAGKVGEAERALLEQLEKERDRFGARRLLSGELAPSMIGPPQPALRGDDGRQKQRNKTAPVPIVLAPNGAKARWIQGENARKEKELYSRAETIKEMGRDRGSPTVSRPVSATHTRVPLADGADRKKAIEYSMPSLLRSQSFEGSVLPMSLPFPRKMIAKVSEQLMIEEEEAEAVLAVEAIAQKSSKLAIEAESKGKPGDSASWDLDIDTLRNRADDSVFAHPNTEADMLEGPSPANAPARQRSRPLRPGSIALSKAGPHAQQDAESGPSGGHTLLSMLSPEGRASLLTTAPKYTKPLSGANSADDRPYADELARISSNALLRSLPERRAPVGP